MNEEKLKELLNKIIEQHTTRVELLSDLEEIFE